MSKLEPKKVKKGWYLHDDKGIREDLGCEGTCKHYPSGEEDCIHGDKDDELTHAFCGAVCGRWEESDAVRDRE